MSELRDLIRQIISEEIAAVLPAMKRAETVSITTDQELNDFARDLMVRGLDGEFADKVRSGQISFMLNGDTGRAVAESSPVKTTSLPKISPPQIAIITGENRPQQSHNTARLVTSHASSTPHKSAVVDIDKRLVTERDLENLTEKSRLRIHKTAVLTPLARDEIRRRGIKLERIAT